jgi:hypothetical protein
MDKWLVKTEMMGGGGDKCLGLHPIYDEDGCPSINFPFGSLQEVRGFSY